MPTLEEFAVTTEYPQPDTEVPAAQTDTVGFEEFMAATPTSSDGVEDMTPAWRSFYSGLGRFNADLARIPAALYDVAAIPQNALARLTGWNIGTKAPEWLVDNPIASYYDRASEAYNYKRQAFANEDFASLMGKGDFSRAGEYLFHSVIENAPSAITAIGGTLAGVPQAQLLGLLGAQAGAQTHAEARAKNLDALEAASAALFNGSLEAVWENAGTFGLLKWGEELFKDVGRQTGKAILKNTLKLTMGSAFREGNEELWTQLTQDFTNKVYGVEDVPWRDFPRRAIEAGAVGAVSGATMTAPGGAIQGLRVSAEQRDKARAEAILQQVRPPEQMPEEQTEARPAQVATPPVLSEQIGTFDPESQRTIYQPSNDAQALLRGAAEQQNDFSNFLSEISAQVPGTTLQAIRVKLPDKVATKIASGKPAETISDYLGGRILVDSVEAVPQVVRAIEDSQRRVGPNENMFVLDRFGYRGYHMQVSLPNGMTAEVQVHVPEIAAVLDQAHSLYDRINYGGISQAQQDALTQQMVQILDDAWVHYLDRVGTTTPILGEAVSIAPLTSEAELAQTAFTRTIAEGGVTVSIKGKQPVSGYVVSPYKAREVQLPKALLTAELFTRYIEANKDLLGQPNHFVGAWESGNVVYLDVVITHPDEATALAIAQEHNQEAIWDVANKSEIFTPFGKARQLAKTAGDVAPLRPDEGNAGAIREAGQSITTAEPAEPRDLTGTPSDVGIELQTALEQLQPVAEQLAASQAGDPYVRNRIISKADTKTLADAIRPLKDAFDKILGFSGSRLADINPTLKHRLRRFDFQVGRRTNQQLARVKPWIDKLDALPEVVRTDLDFALKNRDTETVDRMVEEHGLTSDYAALRELLDDIHREATEVGIDLGYLGTYYPRHIDDVPRFLAYLRNTEHWSAIAEAINLKEAELGRPLDQEDRAAFINALIRGYGDSQIRLSLPANTKNRLIDELTPEMNAFYADSGTALVGYVTSMTNTIEARRLFGKDAQAISDSIGAYVNRLVENGEIDASDEQTVRDILKARFTQKGTHGFWNAYKNAAYIYTMGSPISAITQIGDLAFSLYRNGYYRTSTVVRKAAKGQTVTTLKDLGLDLIAQEFSGGQEATTKAVRKVFTAIGLKFNDALGKLTLIQAGWERLTAESKTNPIKLAADIEPIFGAETDGVIADLAQGRVTDNVKYLLFSEVADFQPVSLSDMPEAYLTAGNARVFYMLKTYSLKLIDVYRNEVVRQISDGNIKQGLNNLVRLSTALMLMNASADLIKDILLGRDKELPDYIVDNLIRLMAFSKWQIYKSRQDGLLDTFWQSIIPPAPFFDDIYRDVVGQRDLPNWRVWGRIPLIGKFYYWWFGGGSNPPEGF